jgi:hypothetical protein
MGGEDPGVVENVRLEETREPGADDPVIEIRGIDVTAPEEHRSPLERTSAAHDAYCR